MAEFDPSKYQRIVKPGGMPGGFDPSKYQRIVKPQTAKDRLMHGAQQRMLSMGDLGSGIREGLQNTGAFATSKLPENYQIPRYKAEPTSEYGQLPIKAGKFLSAFIPGVGAERTVAAGLEAATKLPAWLSRIAGGAAGGAASAPALDASPLTGAALGGAGSTAIEGAAGLLGKYLGRNVTPQQFQAAREAVPENIKAPIGELANSPRAKKAYGRARGIALSQADEPYNQLHDHLTSGVKKLSDGAPNVENPNEFIYDELSRKYEKSVKHTREAFEDLGKEAAINDVSFDREFFDAEIDDSLKEIHGKVRGKSNQRFHDEAKGLTPIADEYKELQKALKSSTPVNEKHYKSLLSNGIDELISKNKDKMMVGRLNKLKESLNDGIEGFDKEFRSQANLDGGNETTKELYKPSLKALNDFKKSGIRSFSDATTIRPVLNDLSKKLSQKGDLVNLRHIEKMKSGLDSSIDKSASQSNLLNDLHEASLQARREQGTFENLDLRTKTPFFKIHEKKGTPHNLISSHIRAGSGGDDFSGLLYALTEKLSPEAKSAVAKSYINPQGESSLAKQLSKLGALSPGQKNAMFGRKSPLAHELSEISGIFPAAKSADFTPLTGYTGSKITQLLAEVGGLGAASASHSPGAALATAGAAAALPAYGQISQRILRSKALKDFYANYLKTAKGKPLTKPKFTEQLARTLAVSATGGNDGS